jgi:hypothetical protein
MSDINAILIYIISIYKLNLFSGMVAHVCNPSTPEAVAGGAQVQGQPGLIWQVPVSKIKNENK